MDLFGEWRNKMNLKDKIAKIEIELAEIKAEFSKQEVEYPLFRRSKHDEKIVKFTSLNEGTVVWKGDIGCTSDNWMSHTDTDTWEEVAYDKDRDLWDGQPILCWNNDDTHLRETRFYDAIHKKAYSYTGRRKSVGYKNYKAVNPDHYEDWIIEAYKTLGR